ncbi:MAG: AAA family ATPase [Oscillospiraceae bacterium]|jgi:septum site-determining protein MinD|nr:AAA family ATPase [Oscillospiraceae bacterium]
MMQTNKDGKVIAVVSGKGGVGKTTLVACMSSCFAAQGFRTLAVDCDYGLFNLDVPLGMSNYTLSDFSDTLEAEDKGAAIDEAAREHPLIPGLFFLSAPDVPGSKIKDEEMREFLAAARERFSYILLDCPAGIGSGFKVSARYADVILINATPDIASSRDASRVFFEIKKYFEHEPETRLVLNRSSDLKHATRIADSFIDNIGAKLIGLIREDRMVSIAAEEGVPLVLAECRGAAMDMLKITLRLQGINVPL